ncbi:hypothetical protein AWC38_SpisGene9547 [Stylophora pistillata]|uniref:Helix-turn-helix domain-containing protein n=1 Tax=Stylophora pistillata TaxID=50429 RepID=A0A2B4SAG0_STYPI|nr:hypothetical protein AWC38_SpisGene9547 [Stylophora pistillata]
MIGGILQPIDKSLVQKIHALVGEGVKTVEEMKRHLRHYVRNDLFAGQNPPPVTNRRYHPKDVDIRNHMYKETVKQMLSKADQESLEEKIKGWKQENPEDLFFFRPYSVSPMEAVPGNTSDTDSNVEAHVTQNLLFLYQTAWQRHLMSRYGNEIMLLDATYKTMRYELPFRLYSSYCVEHCVTEDSNMERVAFHYSTKNIPLASRREFTKQLIKNTEQFLRRMRWKAFHFLNPGQAGEKETFGFKTNNCPPVIEELHGYEDGMQRLIQSVQFKNTKCQFQKELNEDIKLIKNENRLFVKADKSTNFYKLEATKYNQLLNDNITKTYKKADSKQLRKIDVAAKAITKKLGINDRVEVTAQRKAFVTLKDHKDNFLNRPTFRLINPSKQEIGKISKKILENINQKLVNATGVNQWNNTSSVLQWFKNLPNKCESAFISFDVVEFYPSITEDLLGRALDSASNYMNISPDDHQIVLLKLAKESLLFSNETPWQKKNSNGLFDVTMGSYDGAETCQLVGCYLLSQLATIPEINIGLYRDDGLAVINQTPQKVARIKKQICMIFAQNNLRTTIEANKKIINFPDVTVDLITGRFGPYSKPATTPLYVHSKSNHPPCILRNIPEAVNKRPSEISSDEDMFNKAAPLHQDALHKSGYTYKLHFSELEPHRPQYQTKRRRNIIWFNPPFNRNVQTSIGRAFISLIDKCFPVTHKLRKFFNRNTIKLSYSCTPNMKQIIDGHNKATIRNAKMSEESRPQRLCNCKNENECPLGGEYLQSEVVYQATIATREETETYVGLTATDFKTRWRNHRMSFNHGRRRND